MNIKEVISILRREIKKYNIPAAEEVEHTTRDAFKVLVSTILSARTKDEVTMRASRRLFQKVRKPKDLNKLTQKRVEEIIYPVCYYRNKAKYLKKLPSYLVKGVPDTMEELLKIPGVGRKIANIVLNVSFNKHAIAVDTHVHRISNRLGLVKTKTPTETEMELMKKLPKKYWKDYNYLLVVYGQNVCKPISPYCSNCSIRKYCKRVGVKKSR